MNRKDYDPGKADKYSAQAQTLYGKTDTFAKEAILSYLQK